ncbi:hypothetical protein GUJ93_ZPchr0092g38073 [Zizania palustris]|uniref:Uncharacterized protein n=1 Tax=Zizania palustris TaxID=103762 RepID=A0A8J5V236_ZIZPA|nr:hypothetical protein GUJ93_ZPchr0092g38073 [Zizania palustris]
MRSCDGRRGKVIKVRPATWRDGRLGIRRRGGTIGSGRLATQRDGRLGIRRHDEPVLLTEPYNDETLVSWLKGCRGCCVANMERVDGDPMHAIESIFL